MPPVPTTAPPDGPPATAAPPGPAAAGPATTGTGASEGVGWRRVDAALPWVVFAGTLVARLATAARGPTDWDGAQYALGVARFDVSHGRPQPPGYWLYVMTGRLLHATGLGTVAALVAVAALASAAAAGLTVVAGRDLGGRWVGLAAGVVVATSPFAWFDGSTVATYSFDLLAGPVLLLLAWRARPHGPHGVLAVAALGLLAGFRPSVAQAFALLALLPVVVCVRRLVEGLAVVAAGAAAVAVWFVPMVLDQPGGWTSWVRATRIEATGAVRATSVLDHAPGGPTNLGTFAATTVVALAPVAVLAVLAGAGLVVRRMGDGPPRPTTPTGGPDRARPWYQARAAVLGAAIVPPMAVVALVQFAKGGYLLAYLPGAVIALLLVPGALVRPGAGHRRRPAGWVALASLGVAAVALLGAQRFLSGDGVLPARWLASSGPLWLVQPRYQAPFPDTRTTIRAADEADAALAGLAAIVDPRRDVIVFDAPDGGGAIYRNAGWALPGHRSTLLAPGAVLYNQLGGDLYYASGSTVAVGRAGSVYLVASPALPGLAALVTGGYARPVSTPRPIGGFRVFRVRPGATVLGVRVVEQPGPRPLGTGI